MSAMEQPKGETKEPSPDAGSLVDAEFRVVNSQRVQGLSVYKLPDGRIIISGPPPSDAESSQVQLPHGERLVGVPHDEIRQLFVALNDRAGEVDKTREN